VLTRPRSGPTMWASQSSTAARRASMPAGDVEAAVSSRRKPSTRSTRRRRAQRARRHVWPGACV
jgi:hypothetical protein